MRCLARRGRRWFSGASCAWLLTLLAAQCAVPAQAQAQPTTPLLPLARGQLVVSIGTPPQWLPEGRTPTGVTLLSGRPRGHPRHPLNAYIALQGGSRKCARSAAGDHASTLLVMPAYYAKSDLIASQPGSPYSGAQAGDYAVTLSNVTIKQLHTVRACVWLAPSEKARGLVLSQTIQLLNGLFAASVSDLASASPGIGGAYTLDAVDVGSPFSYAISTLQCGDHYQDSASHIGTGTLATDSIAIETNPCAGDGSTYTFTNATGAALGTVSYLVAQATSAPPAVASLGGCELDPISVLPLAEATQYLTAVGCVLHSLVLAPYSSALPRGAVIEAQVDGGLAEVAPRGTAVDLELNGSPAPSTSRR